MSEFPGWQDEQEAMLKTELKRVTLEREQLRSELERVTAECDVLRLELKASEDGSGITNIQAQHDAQMDAQRAALKETVDQLEAEHKLRGQAEADLSEALEQITATASTYRDSQRTATKCIAESKTYDERMHNTACAHIYGKIATSLEVLAARLRERRK